MNNDKHFPTDYSDEEIKSLLSELNEKIERGILTEGEQINVERKIMVCQNQLLLSSLIKSNEKLNQQQTTLVSQQQTLASQFNESEKANKRTSKEAKIIILLTILTILITSALDWHHMTVETENQKKMIEELDTLIIKADGFIKDQSNLPQAIQKVDTIKTNYNNNQQNNGNGK